MPKTSLGTSPPRPPPPDPPPDPFPAASQLASPRPVPSLPSQSSSHQPSSSPPVAETTGSSALVLNHHAASTPPPGKEIQVAAVGVVAVPSSCGGAAAFLPDLAMSPSPNPCAATSPGPGSPLPGSDGSGSWSSAPPRSSPALKLDPAFSTPAPTATSTTQEVAAPDPAAGGNSQSSSSSDCLPTPEMQLEIAIEVVHRLDMAEETRSLSLQEQSLREFLLDRIANLQEALGAHDDEIPRDQEFSPDDHEDAIVVESSAAAVGSLPGSESSATSTTQEVAAPDPAAGSNSQSSSSSSDCHLTPEMQLETAIEVVYRLDMAEETRLLSLEEQSLREFLLDQIANLQEAVGAHDDVIPPDQEFSPDDHDDAIVVESSAAAVGSLPGSGSSATSTTQEVATTNPAAGSNSQSSSSSSDCLTPEIQLEIAIEIVYRLDMAEKTRSLSLHEQSLREFALDRIVDLQEAVGAHDDEIPPDQEFFPDDHEDAMVVESSAAAVGWLPGSESSTRERMVGNSSSSPRNFPMLGEQLHPQPPPGSIGQAISSRASAAAMAEPEATSVLSSFGQEWIIENVSILHLPTDIIQKILFNITDPASLVCLTLTCKCLRNIIMDPSFLDCLRLRCHDHGFVPSLLLGFFNQEWTKSPLYSLQRETDKWCCLAPRFMPTSSFSFIGRKGCCGALTPVTLDPFLRRLGGNLNFCKSIASQDSFLALSYHSKGSQAVPDRLFVCNPLTGDIIYIPPVQGEQPDQYALLVTEEVSPKGWTYQSFKLVAIWVTGKSICGFQSYSSKICGVRSYSSKNKCWAPSGPVPALLPGLDVVLSPCCSVS